MRIALILSFFLLIILSNLQQTDGNSDCRCECCTSQNCNPSLIGTHSLWFCSEPTTCTKNDCISWHPARCPREDASGQTRAILFVPNHSRRSIRKPDQILWNTTRVMVPYRRPSTMPQIRLDWLEKFGLLKKTTTSATSTYSYKQRF